MPNSSWDNEQIKYLFENYSHKSNAEISKILNKKISTIKEYARRHGLVKQYDYNQSKRVGSLYPLLEESPEAYYWIGFIFADGTLSLNGRLSVTTSWDGLHLEKLAKFIGGNVTINKKSENINNYSGSRKLFYRVSIKDIKHHQQLRDKFNISNIKTYVVHDLDFFTEDWMFHSFLIGFIDGDGNINCGIRLINHRNWFNSHILISQKLADYGIHSKYKINKRNESELYISAKYRKMAIKFINDNDLPVLKRKWYNINYKL